MRFSSITTYRRSEVTQNLDGFVSSIEILKRVQYDSFFGLLR